MRPDIFLIGNYFPDRQESMQRFAQELHRHLGDLGISAKLLVPQKVLNILPHSPLGKWMGYCDKYLLFPRVLRKHQAKHPDSLYHILDHSNALYGVKLRTRSWLLTCHDLTALRAAKGEFRHLVSISTTGRKLQTWIARGMKQAPQVVCDSLATKQDFLRIIGKPEGGEPAVIYPGLSADFCSAPPPAPEYEGALITVGSNAWNKRRDRVLRIHALVVAKRGGIPLLVIGEPLSERLRQLALELGTWPFMVELGRITDAELAGLYQVAGALLFPSEAEGFGWPVAEALACGCPVVASARGALPEVTYGDLASSSDGDDEALAAEVLRFLGMTKAELAQHRKSSRDAVLSRFQWATAADAYVAEYRRLCDPRLGIEF